MKTTIDIPDELWKRAKVYGAETGRSLAALVAEGLDRVVPRHVTVHMNEGEFHAPKGKRKGGTKR